MSFLNNLCYMYANVCDVWLGVIIMVFSVTFINISEISWWSVLLVVETRVPGEKHRPAACYHKIYHIMLYQLHFA